MAEAPSTAQRPPLRAADWRFLLPYPEHGRFRTLVLLGGPPGLADLLVEIGVAEVVTRSIPSTRSVDAVVALYDARWRYQDVAGCLLRGGALYCEIDRRSLRHTTSTPHRVRRSLERVGLVPTGAYVVGPSLYRPRVYVPLDARGALKWYVRTQFNAWRPRVAVGEASLRAVIALSRGRVAPFVPHFAVTAIAGDPRGRPFVLGAHVLPAELDGEELHPLLMGCSHHETLSQRVVILPFDSEGPRPRAVVKVSKLPALNATLETEHAVMADVRRRLDAGMCETVPVSLRVERWGELTSTSETYSPGESIQRSSFRWGRPLAAKLDDLRVAAGWLAEFHRQTQVSRAPWSAATRSELVDVPLERYRQAFGTTDGEEHLFAEMQRYADSIVGTPLPFVLRKPDFFGSNVIRSGHSLSVVDWESPHVGPALCDLLRFVAPWSQAVAGVDGDRLYEIFRALFFSTRPDAVPDAVRREIARYMSHLSMDPRLFPVLLVYTWVDRAIHHFEKYRRHGERPDDTRAGNRHIGRVAVLSEHVEQLFDPSHAPGARLLPRQISAVAP